ncbi:MAG: metallophosphoesterase [Clostridia bacterium]|nr:metallophosphoesterase [Clostridia bacterium]
MKKIFVVSDIHGHCTLLQKALERAGFDDANEDHLLICCGDYFDRGTENAEVMKFFERIKHKILIQGNHEELLMKVFNTGKMQPHNYVNGTLQTLESFFDKYSIDPVDDSIDFSGKTRTVDRICDFISEMVDYYETEKYLFVHGWFPPQCLSAEDRLKASEEDWRKARWLLWTDHYNGERPLPDKTVVCGHMPTLHAHRIDPTRKQANADIYQGNGLIAIDAATFDTKQVNVLVIEDELRQS